MRKCKWIRAGMLAAAACATIGYNNRASGTTFYYYNANSDVSAPDPTTAPGGTWQSVIGGTATPITAAAGTGTDGNYWQITDNVTNGSKGYGIVTPAPAVSIFQDPTGWTATMVAKVLVSSGPKVTQTATVGAYAAPSFFDIRGNNKLATMGQVNAGADEFFFRAKGGSSTDIPLQDMDVHSYFNTYQMVYQPPVLDDEGGLVAPESLREYVNGFLMSDTTAINGTGVTRIQWFSGAQTSAQTIQYQLINFETGNTVVPAPAPEVWSAGSGSLSLGGNWTSGNAPSGPMSTAHFGNQGGPTTITVDAPRSVGILELDSTAPYTIDGTATLTLVQSRRGTGAIDVVQGNHTIVAPLSFERAGMFTIIDPAASLSIVGPVDSTGKGFRKAGEGAMDVANIRANALKVSGGTLTVRANGTAAGVSKVTSLDISFNTTAALVPTATMQLNDNPIIVDYTGSAPTTTLRNSLKGAFNGGAWDGKGLTSANVKAVAADTNNPYKTALGYGDASVIGVAMVGDQTLDQTSLLVRITLSGDANMDGKVNGLDFNALASNFGPTTTHIWTQGDFNYDGVINSVDFAALATNYNQSMTLSPASALGTLVPEPVSATLLGMLALVSLRRRPARARWCGRDGQ